MEFWLLKLGVRPKQYFEFDIPVLDYPLLQPKKIRHCYNTSPNKAKTLL